MEKQGNKVLAIVGIVLGAFAIIFSFWYMINIAALIAGVAGIVLTILAKKSYDEAGTKTPLTTVALILSIVGTVLAVIGFFTCTVCVCAIASDSEVQSALSSLEALNY